MKPIVYITRKLPGEIINQLSGHCEIRMWEESEKPVPRPVLEKEIENASGLLCLLTESIDRDLLDRAKQLKIVSNMAVGYNNIDIEAAAEKGITVTNTPGVLTETTADLTFALLMATSRRLVEASEYLKDGRWETWSPMQLTGQDIHGATLGIIGMGRIGESVVKRARGFEMNVLYHNRSKKPEMEEKYNAIYMPLDDLLAQSDFVCILTPYTPETRNLITARELSLMKKNAILINTARGGIVDEKALYEALKEKRIWGAGIDTFEEEPVDLNNPLLTMENVVALPHIGSASIKTRMKMAGLAIENLVAGIQDKPPRHVVV